MQSLLLLTPTPDLLVDPQGNKRPLVQNGKLLLADWKVKRNPLRCMAYKAIQPRLYPSHKDRVLLQVANHPGIRELVDVLGKKLIHFVQV